MMLWSFESVAAVKMFEFVVGVVALHWELVQLNQQIHVFWYDEKYMKYLIVKLQLELFDALIFDVLK